MEQENKLLQACLYISAVLLLQTYPNAIAYDRPVHTVILAFSFAGFLLLSLNKTSPNLLRHRRTPSRTYNAVPLEDHQDLGAAPEAISEQHDRRAGPGPGIARLMLVTSILALTVRIELFRRILKATECTVSTIEVRPSCYCHLASLKSGPDSHSSQCCYLRCSAIPETKTKGQTRILR